MFDRIRPRFDTARATALLQQLIAHPRLHPSPTLTPVEDSRGWQPAAAERRPPRLLSDYWHHAGSQETYMPEQAPCLRTSCAITARSALCRQRNQQRLSSRKRNLLRNFCCYGAHSITQHRTNSDIRQRLCLHLCLGSRSRHHMGRR